MQLPLSGNFVSNPLTLRTLLVYLPLACIMMTTAYGLSGSDLELDADNNPPVLYAARNPNPAVLSAVLGIWPVYLPSLQHL